MEAINSTKYKIKSKPFVDEVEVVEFNEANAPDVPEPRELAADPDALVNVADIPITAKNKIPNIRPVNARIVKLKKHPFIDPVLTFLPLNPPVKMDPKNTVTTITIKM